MEFEILDRNDLLTAANLEHADRSLRFALSRFSNEIERVKITATDTNGPRGGAAMECLGQVTLRGRQTVEVKQSSIDFGSGITQLARRLARVVGRKIKTRQRFTRDSIRRSDETSFLGT